MKSMTKLLMRYAKCVWLRVAGLDLAQVRAARARLHQRMKRSKRRPNTGLPNYGQSKRLQSYLPFQLPTCRSHSFGEI